MTFIKNTKKTTFQAYQAYVNLLEIGNGQKKRKNKKIKQGIKIKYNLNVSIYSLIINRNGHEKQRKVLKGQFKYNRN